MTFAIFCNGNPLTFENVGGIIWLLFLHFFSHSKGDIFCKVEYHNLNSLVFPALLAEKRAGWLGGSLAATSSTPSRDPAAPARLTLSRAWFKLCRFVFCFVDIYNIFIGYYYLFAVFVMSFLWQHWSLKNLQTKCHLGKLHKWCYISNLSNNVWHIHGCQVGENWKLGAGPAQCILHHPSPTPSHIFLI